MTTSHAPRWDRIDGETVRLIREARGLSPAELADRSRLSRSQIGRIEDRHAHAPHLGTAHRLAEALGVKVSTLFVERPNHVDVVDYLSAPKVTAVYEQQQDARFCLQFRKLPNNMILPPQVLGLPEGMRVFAAAGWPEEHVAMLDRTRRVQSDTHHFAHKSMNLLCVLPWTAFVRYEPDWIAATMNRIREWGDRMGVLLLNTAQAREIDEAVRQGLGIETWESVGSIDGYVQLIRPTHDRMVVQDHGTTTRQFCSRIHNVLRPMIPGLRNAIETPAASIIRRVNACTLTQLDRFALSLRRARPTRR